MLKILIVFGAGLIAGFINVNAGGGSLLTLPALILCGLPPSVANGTNRISILSGAISATSKFKKHGMFDLNLSLWLSIPALIGAIIGSSIVVTLPDSVFNLILSIVMVFVMTVMLINPQKRFKRKHETVTRQQTIIAAFSFFFVGFYGGFIQVGVGIFMIAILSIITGLPLVKINSLKMVVVGVYTICALAVFVLHSKVDWIIGCVLALGSASGSYIGTHFSIKKGDTFIRIILAIAVVAMAVKLAFSV